MYYFGCIGTQNSSTFDDKEQYAMAGLTQAQLNQLDEQGYVVVDNVLNPERDLAPVMAEIWRRAGRHRP